MPRLRRRFFSRVPRLNKGRRRGRSVQTADTRNGTQLTERSATKEELTDRGYAGPSFLLLILSLIARGVKVDNDFKYRNIDDGERAKHSVSRAGHERKNIVSCPGSARETMFFLSSPVRKLKLSRKITNHESRNHPRETNRGPHLANRGLSGLGSSTTMHFHRHKYLSRFL